VSSAPASPFARKERVSQALERLGIRNVLLGIQDAAFPARDDEDVGRGSPYSEGAAEFLAFVRELGFGGIQLGPQGATSAGDPSPYDGTVFSRNPVSLALRPLTRPESGAFLRPEELDEIVSGRSGPADRVSYRYAYASFRRVVALTTERIVAARDRSDPLLARHARAFAAFHAEHAAWLERDGLYGALKSGYEGRPWTEWPEVDRRLFDPPPGGEARAEERRRDLKRTHADALFAWSVVQYLLHVQHAGLQERARGLGLKLFGDLQIGLSPRDAWAAQGLAMRAHLMGAPPSRTNPEGQAWNYPVLDPALYNETDPDGRRRAGPVVRFLEARVLKMFAEFDGLRVDHPHGFVCPWVYEAGRPDPVRAVREGARLFASPDLPEHPALAAHAIARPGQLDRTVPRHADGWVRELDDDQVERYAVLFDVIVEAARSHGRDVRDVACEILSTQPYPLGRVIERHGIGRFRVTQKADLDRADDVYRGENARPQDWIMLGNHDTPPIWRVARGWVDSGASRAQAEYLASRLLASEEDREEWVRRVASDRDALVEARFADLFVGPASNVMVFFTDLLGFEELYNRPGVVSEDNWSLRVPPAFREQYAERAARGRALVLTRALARALRARGGAFVAAHRSLIEDLERGAGREDSADGRTASVSDGTDPASSP
jgi:4-alpha-glucanotransferase